MMQRSSRLFPAAACTLSASNGAANCGAGCMLKQEASLQMLAFPLLQCPGLPGLADRKQAVRAPEYSHGLHLPSQ